MSKPSTTQASRTNQNLQNLHEYYHTYGNIPKGAIIKVNPDRWWKQAADIYIDTSKEKFINALKNGSIRNSKRIDKNTVGFVVSDLYYDSKFDLDCAETWLWNFDWLIEVCFPSINLQGWGDKRDLEFVKTV